MGLEELRYEIQFRKGSENLVADYLSRNASTYDCDINDDGEHFERKIYNATELKESTFIQYLCKEQKDDPVISKALYEIETDGTIQTGQFKRYSQMKTFWFTL